MKPRRKFIVWSYDEEDQQVFADIVTARSSKEAETLVANYFPRMNAKLDSVCPSMPLEEYIRNLQAVARKKEKKRK